MIRKILTALALTATVAQPAQANDDLAKILFGVIVGAAIVDAAKNTHRPVDNAAEINRIRTEQDHAIQRFNRQQNDSACYTQDRFENNGRVIRYVFNCRNEVIHAFYP
jgi:hypothetical protein